MKLVYMPSCKRCMQFVTVISGQLNLADCIRHPSAESVELKHKYNLSSYPVLIANDRVYDTKLSILAAMKISLFKYLILRLKAGRRCKTNLK